MRKSIHGRLCKNETNPVRGRKVKKEANWTDEPYERINYLFDAATCRNFGAIVRKTEQG